MASGDLPDSENVLLLVLLEIAILITNSQTAALYVEVGPHEKLALTSSFGSIIFWTGILLLGPMALWSNLIPDLFSGIRHARQLRRLNQSIF